MTAPASGRFTLAGVELAGIVFGHTITYLLAIRTPVHRGEHLAAAGHSYWVPPCGWR